MFAGGLLRRRCERERERACSASRAPPRVCFAPLFLSVLYLTCRIKTKINRIRGRATGFCGNSRARKVIREEGGNSRSAPGIRWECEITRANKKIYIWEWERERESSKAGNLSKITISSLALYKVLQFYCLLNYVVNFSFSHALILHHENFRPPYLSRKHNL